MLALAHGHLRAKTRVFMPSPLYSRDAKPKQEMPEPSEATEGMVHASESEVMESKVAGPEIATTESPESEMAEPEPEAVLEVEMPAVEMDFAEVGPEAEEPLPVDEELPVEKAVYEMKDFRVRTGKHVHPVSRFGRGLSSATKKGARLGAGLLLIGRSREKEMVRSGYLAFAAPNVLRFSDDQEINNRPPAPALPEFNIVGSEHMPYLVESALPEDAMNDLDMLAEIVVELEPHTVLSGKIDTSRAYAEERIENFEVDEPRSTALRPEEVLIFFESNGVNSNTNAIIPFAPATPSAETIKSSAKFSKE